MFSEPGSGSDLAGAMTRAEFKGNRWVINGQKVWTTSAHHADWGLLLARTDWDEPKHQGLSYFVLDMHQPGVEVHPLRQMNGHASFNQVFFTDAEVPPENLVGEVGARLGGGDHDADARAARRRRHAHAGRRPSDRPGRIYDEERAENATVDGALQVVSAARRPRRSGDRAGARRPGEINDPVVRQEIAKLLMPVEGGGMDRAARARGAGAGPAAGAGRLARQAGVAATSRARRRGCTR